MKNRNEMKIYLLAQTSLLPLWTSLMGDKYRDALPFKWSFTEEPLSADVIAWDGFRNPKADYYLHEIVSSLKQQRQLLFLQREAYTLFDDYPFLAHINLEELQYVELASGNILPEDLLAGLEACHKKLNNV